MFFMRGDILSANSHIPDLKEALRETAEYDLPESAKKKVNINPADIPPPPRDWTAHPVTRIIFWLILLGIIVVFAVNGPGMLEYAKVHRLGTTLTGIALFVFIFLIAFSYWKYRTVGDNAMTYWDTERKKKPR